MKHLQSYFDKQPVIAGGLIRERREVEKLLEKDVFAVSTSNEELWDW